MAFQEYNELVEPLELPINGKTYTIPPVGLDEGIRLADLLNPASEVPFTDEEAFTLVLGSALGEMRTDHVTPAAIRRAFRAALADWQRDRSTAEMMWVTGGDPKALTEQVEQVRAALEKAVTTPPAAETTTKPPASGTGTKKTTQTKK